MGDEIKNGAPDAAQLLSEAGLDDENPIDALHAEAEAEEAALGEVEGAEKPGEKPAGDDAAQARVDKVEEDNITLRTQLEFLRGQVATLTAQGGVRGSDTKPPEAPKPKRVELPSEEEIRNAISSEDGAKNLDNLTKMFVSLAKQMNEALDDVRNNTTKNFATRDNDAHFKAALTTDYNKAAGKWSADLLQDPEFVQDGNALSAELEKARGSGDYVAGDFYNLSMQVVEQWRENGKLDAWKAKRNGGNRNGSGKAPSLREVRANFKSSDVIENGNGARSGDGGTTLASLYPNPRELRIVKMNMRRNGVSEKEWIANVMAARKEDSSFGN